MTFRGREATSWSNDALKKVVCARVMYRFNSTQLNHPCSWIKLKIYIEDVKHKTCRYHWICGASKADYERVRGHTLEDKHWQNLHFVLKVFVVQRDDQEITAYTNRFCPPTTKVLTLKIRNPTRSNATVCFVATMSLACCASIFSQPASISIHTRQFPECILGFPPCSYHATGFSIANIARWIFTLFKGGRAWSSNHSTQTSHRWEICQDNLWNHWIIQPLLTLYREEEIWQEIS